MSWKAAQVLDRDAPYDYGAYHHPDECLKTIKAGQAHAVLPFSAPPDYRDTSSDPEFRACLACVRVLNDSVRDPDAPILVKVELTYSDGSTRYIEGDAADDYDYEHLTSEASLVASIHSYPFHQIPWKTRKD